MFKFLFGSKFDYEQVGVRMGPMRPDEKIREKYIKSYHGNMYWFYYNWKNGQFLISGSVGFKDVKGIVPEDIAKNFHWDGQVVDYLRNEYCPEIADAKPGTEYSI